MKIVLFNFCGSIIISLVLFSCEFKRNELNTPSNLLSISFDIDKAKETSIEDLCNDIELIPLENNENASLTGFHTIKIIPFNNDLYVLDGQLKQEILIFNKQGKYLRKINKTGRGPGEYINISDFDINPKSSNVEILQANGILYTYDLNGNFINTTQINSDSIRAFHYLASISEDIVVFYTSTISKRVSFFSKKKKKIIRRTHIVPNECLINTNLAVGRSPFQRYGGNVYFHEPFSNIIYIVTNDQLIEYIEWDFGKYHFSEDMIAPGKTVKENMDFLYKNNKWVVKKIQPFESENYMIINGFVNRNELYTMVYNKNSGEQKIIKGSFAEASYYLWFTQNFPDFGNNIALSLIDAFKINDIINPEILSDKNKYILESIKETDNPVIVKYHLK
jgi:hypothetical protein